MNLRSGTLSADGSVLAQLDTDLSVGTRVSTDQGTGPRRFAGPTEGQVLVDDEVLVAVAAEGWSGSGDDAVGPTFGGLLGVDPGSDGTFDVSYRTPWVRRFALLAQVLMVAAAFGLSRAERTAVPADGPKDERR